MPTQPTAVLANGESPGFLKTTLLGAILVVVPIGIVGFALWQVFNLVRGVLLPVFDGLPLDSAAMKASLLVSAVLVVVLLCYFTGVVVRTRWGAALRGWLERRLLEKIPGYAVIRSLIHQYLGHEGERTFRPILVDLYNSGARSIGFEVEDLGDGNLAVFLPAVPAATVGNLYLVPETRTTPIAGSMHATIEVLASYGVGAAALTAAPAVAAGGGALEGGSKGVADPQA